MNSELQSGFTGFDKPAGSGKGALEERFIVPPFSLLDTRQGYWRERKQVWIELGIQSEVGRKDDLTFGAEGDSFTAGVIADRGGGTSIFDPVLCELMYRWFAKPGGTVLDPFAGGSVRGIVAAKLGLAYTGIDLCEEQLVANREQGAALVPDNQPTWLHGDSMDAAALLGSAYYDFIFSCPPYHDLEQYTEDPRDISRLSWGSFLKAYRQIIEAVILRLKNNRFAVFVVSEIRDEHGAYKGLVPATIAAFEQGGMRYYNEIILLNMVGSLSVRITKQFGSGRKIGRTHQNVLVFYKGDMEAIGRTFPTDVDAPLVDTGGGDETA